MHVVAASPAAAIAPARASKALAARSGSKFVAAP